MSKHDRPITKRVPLDSVDCALPLEGSIVVLDPDDDFELANEWEAAKE